VPVYVSRDLRKLDLMYTFLQITYKNFSRMNILLCVECTPSLLGI